MYTIRARNVNDAWPQGWSMLHDKRRSALRDSRGGPVLEATETVATMYTMPRQRVLFDPVRDANPFFHFMEALWILGGRRDVEFLAKFNKQMAEYSDDGVRFHAAYGHRLRSAFGLDQLQAVIYMLERDTDTRRAVLQIWGAEMDLATNSRDIPCNDTIFLLARNNYLDMTVCCRSNDAIWGCYGANAVQFSILQEYIALSAGLAIGSLTQISNSLHTYTESEIYRRIRLNGGPSMVHQPYLMNTTESELVFRQTPEFEDELQEFLSENTGSHYSSAILENVAVPMMLAYQAYREGDLDRALIIVDERITPAADDWKEACKRWLKRRIYRRDNNGGGR